MRNHALVAVLFLACSGQEQGLTTRVLAARGPLAVGQAVEEELLIPVALPEGLVGPGMIRAVALAGALGRQLVVDLKAGDLLTEGALSPAGMPGDLAAATPAKGRSVTVLAGGADEVRAGDLVDVLVTLVDPATREPTLVTLLNRVRVVGIEGPVAELRKVTLRTLPEEAELLGLAQQVATIHLALRNPDDVDVSEERGRTTMQTLLTGERMKALQTLRYRTIQIIRGAESSGGGSGRYPTPTVAARHGYEEPVVEALRAGATDDNEGYAEFLLFLGRWTDRAGMAGRYEGLDVRDRRYLQAVDGQGAPIPAATVRVLDAATKQVVWTGTTYGDGRVPFYPHRVKQQGEGFLVETTQGEQVTWNGKADVKVLREAPAEARVQLDVLFAIDTTGSMADEIARIKTTLLSVTRRLRQLKQGFDLRYGAVLYRDRGDDYVTRVVPFTGSLAGFDRVLQGVEAGGGGDTPESVNAALAKAVAMPWRDGAAKVVFLIGDAPPHMDYGNDVTYGVSLAAANRRGIRVHAVAASGLDAEGTLIWRQIAQYTRGKFVFIEYGSAEAAAESHGVTGNFSSNNLDTILYDQIRDELTNWGRDKPIPSSQVARAPGR